MEEWLGSPPPHDEAGTHAEGTPETEYSLFAFPAEDNFAGVKFPLDWATAVKRKSTERHKWMVRARTSTACVSAILVVCTCGPGQDYRVLLQLLAGFAFNEIVPGLCFIVTTRILFLQVLVDAAAYVPTQPLDLSTLDADFVDIAFYKLFGE